MADKKSLTARIYRAMAIFSGTQAASILCSVVRTKLVAVWIGAAGVGLFSVFNTAADMLATVTQLGMRTSAVRDIAAAPRGSELRRRMQGAVARWSLLLGMLGMILTAGASPLLSLISFGSTERWPLFVMLSPVLLFGSLTNGRQAILQATGRLRALARAALWGTVAALAIAVPLIYLLRIDSVVPIIAVYSATLFAATMMQPLPADGDTPLSTGWRETLRLGRGFIRLGAYMTVAAGAVSAAAYVLVSWITVSGGGDTTAGYYQAGNTLLLRYVGLLFTAIAMEFYPRLSAVADNRRYASVYVNHEIMVLLRPALPLAIAFMICAPWIVTLLYDKEFLVIVPYVTAGMLGIVARIPAWTLSYMILARGDGRVYMLSECASALAGVLLNILCFTLWGITGFGIAFAAWYLFYLAMVWAICRIRYGFRMAPAVVRALAGSALLIILLQLAVSWIR